MFIVGIVGAINAVISQSQNPNKNTAISQLAKLVGLNYEAPADPARPLNYVPDKIKEETPDGRPSDTFTPKERPLTTVNQTNVAVVPSPTPATAITSNTQPPAPPIPPSAPNTLGDKDQLVMGIPNPPLSPNTQLLGTKDNTIPTPASAPNKKAPEQKNSDNAVYDTVVSFFEDIYNSFKP